MRSNDTHANVCLYCYYYFSLIICLNGDFWEYPIFFFFFTIARGDFGLCAERNNFKWPAPFPTPPPKKRIRRCHSAAISPNCHYSNIGSLYKYIRKVIPPVYRGHGLDIFRNSYTTTHTTFYIHSRAVCNNREGIEFLKVCTEPGELEREREAKWLLFPPVILNYISKAVLRAKCQRLKFLFFSRRSLPFFRPSLITLSTLRLRCDSLPN